MSKRAAIYARVSTKDQKDHGYSLPTQIDVCAAYALEQGYTLVCDAFQDDYTGMSMDRPALDALRGAIPAYQIDVVIVFDLDRLARKMAYQMLIEDELAKLGATIEYANGRYADTDEGRLQKQIKGVIAEYERAKILERLKRGKRGKAKSGKVVMAAHTPYGYTRDGDQLYVNETEAAVVRQIFAWYTGPEQLTIHQIALRLTREHAPTRRAVSWQTSLIGRMLHNETYIGRWHFGVRDIRIVQGKQVTTRYPRAQWIAVAVPAIIDEATLTQASERARLNLTHARRNRKHLYLFSGMLTCDGCKRTLGGTYHDASHQRYACTRNRIMEGDRRCRYVTITRESLLIDHVWPWLCEIVDNPERTRAALAERENAHAETFAPLRARLATIEARLEDTTQQLRNALDTYNAGKGTMPAVVLDHWLADETHRIQRVQADLEKERADLAIKVEAEDWNPAHSDDVWTFCATLRGRMVDATPEQQRAALEALRFTGRLVVEDGCKVLYASCVLGEKTFPLQNTGKADAITSTSSQQRRSNTLVLTARFVLGPARQLRAA